MIVVTTFTSTMEFVMIRQTPRSVTLTGEIVVALSLIQDTVRSASVLKIVMKQLLRQLYIQSLQQILVS